MRYHRKLMFCSVHVIIVFLLCTERGHIIVGKLRELRVCSSLSHLHFCLPLAEGQTTYQYNYQPYFHPGQLWVSIVTVCPHTISVRSTATAVQTVSMN